MSKRQPDDDGGRRGRGSNKKDEDEGLRKRKKTKGKIKRDMEEAKHVEEEENIRKQEK